LWICGILYFCTIDFYTKNENVKDDSVYKIKYYAVKFPTKEPQGSGIFPLQSDSVYYTYLNYRRLGQCSIPLKIRLLSTQVYLRQGSLYINIYQVIT
jgi:hypothetical protein